MNNYNILFVTNIPSFYKLNLYNSIAKKKKVMVIFTGTGADGRNDDFYRGNKNFDFLFLNGSVLMKTLRMIKVLQKLRYDELVVGGWDTLMMLVAPFFSDRLKNSVVVESSIHESNVHGVKAWIKKAFLRRISCAYVPGISNEKLMHALDFKGKIVQTKGVGVFNYIPQPPLVKRNEVKKFLYVGRLIEVKNLKFLIETFNDLPLLELTIAGFGELEGELKAIAKNNVHFVGAVDNTKLPQVYQSHDVFVLPSKSEPWGLVVEEALNNGLPVIVSERVGCQEAIVNKDNGLVFKYDDKDGFRKAVLKMTELDYYNQLRENISKYDFERIEQEQVNCYL